MIVINYKPSFVRQFKHLDPVLQDEVIAKIDLLKDKKNHKALKVQKLKGRLSDFYGFSVDYKHRIVFTYEPKNEIVLLAVGDHDVYK